MECYCYAPSAASSGRPEDAVGPDNVTTARRQVRQTIAAAQHSLRLEDYTSRRMHLRLFAQLQGAP